MYKKEEKQHCIELGEIPTLLQGGVAYRLLSRGSKNEHVTFKRVYRERLYELMDDVLGDDRPKNRSSYRKYFSDPKKNVNEAFLNNQRSNERKWHQLMNAMLYAMSEVLAVAIEESRMVIRHYQEREKSFSSVLETYVNEAKEEASHGRD
jgi:hypothetical protein